MDYSTCTLDFTAEGRRRVHLFGFVLGYSRRQYLRFVERQDFETTVREHIRAFQQLRGVAATCLYDNMKVVVSGFDGLEPIYNPRFLAFATHYGFKSWACRPRRGQTKGKIERPFSYAENSLLNGRTFQSLAHLNDVTQWWLEHVSDVHLHRTTNQRPLDRHAEELPYLIPLPARAFHPSPVVYGEPGERYPYWVVAESIERGIILVHCAQGFGPEFPWGFLITGAPTSAERTTLGMDSQWNWYLEEAFVRSGLWPGRLARNEPIHLPPAERFGGRSRPEA